MASNPWAEIRDRLLTGQMTGTEVAKALADTADYAGAADAWTYESEHPDGQALQRSAMLSAVVERVGLPAVVKPARAGSAMGISFVELVVGSSSRRTSSRALPSVSGTASSRIRGRGAT